MCKPHSLHPNKVGSHKSFLNLFFEARVTMHVLWCAAFFSLWVREKGEKGAVVWFVVVMWVVLYGCLSVHVLAYNCI